MLDLNDFANTFSVKLMHGQHIWFQMILRVGQHKEEKDEVVYAPYKKSSVGTHTVYQFNPRFFDDDYVYRFGITGPHNQGGYLHLKNGIFKPVDRRVARELVN